MTSDATVFLVDVDNTLLDNDRDPGRTCGATSSARFGAACRDRYWTILEQLLDELGYRDYLGALQRYRVEHPRDIAPALDVVASWSTIRSRTGSTRTRSTCSSDSRAGADGHPVRRRRRLPAAQGRARRHRRGGRRPRADLHPQGAGARRRRAALPGPALRPRRRQAAHPRPPSSRSGASRVTTVFPRQGHYAHDPKALAAYPAGRRRRSSASATCRLTTCPALIARRPTEGDTMKADHDSSTTSARASGSTTSRATC